MRFRKNTVFTAFIFAVSLTLTAFAVGAVYASAAEQGTQSFVILINGKNAGTETVIKGKDESGNVVYNSEHELVVDDGLSINRTVFSTKMVLSKDAKDIKTYDCRYKTSLTGDFGDSYDVSIKNGVITRVLTHNGQSINATAPHTQNTVIVDFDVYHHYEYLIRRYDRKKKGTQIFEDFIPVIGNVIPLKVTWIGDEKVRFYEKTVVEVSKFTIEFAGIHTVTVLVDKSGSLSVLENPAQNLKVIRKDLIN